MEEEDISTLPLLTLLSHKSWKARKLAYEQMTSSFKSLKPVPQDALSFFRKLHLEANVATMDAGLTALVTYLDNAEEPAAVSAALRMKKEFCPGLIEKCLGGKVGNRQKAVECLMLVADMEGTDYVVVCWLCCFPKSFFKGYSFDDFSKLS